MGQAYECITATCEVAKDNVMAYSCCKGSKKAKRSDQRTGGKAWYDSIDKYNSSDEDEETTNLRSNSLMFDDDDEEEEQVVIIKTNTKK